MAPPFVPAFGTGNSDNRSSRAIYGGVDYDDCELCGAETVTAQAYGMRVCPDCERELLP